MRVTRETLLRIAKETAIQRIYADSKLIAVYLTGSLLHDPPFLGGVTDIDLIFVHAGIPPFDREIVPLSDELHLDITHRTRGDYERPRELRVHPWLGYEMYDPLLLHESQHFFEFVQAGVRAHFHEPATVLQRARNHLAAARQIGAPLRSRRGVMGPFKMLTYLKAISHAANAVAVLNGPPLAERRFLLDFPSRAANVGQPGLTARLFGLLGASNVDATILLGWLPDWEAAFTAATALPGDPCLHIARLPYYQKAFEAFIGGDHPMAAIWPLFHAWTLAAAALPVGDPQRTWQAACKKLGLSDEGFEEKLPGLDQYLDNIEELLDGMAAARGV